MAMQEQRWTSGLRRGDFEIYRSIFEHLTPQLWRFARLSVPHDVAEDIVQDVMFDLWQRRTVITVQQGLIPYLFGAVRKKVAMHLRHDRVVRHTEDDTLGDHPPGMAAAPTAPDSHVIADDLESALVDAFAQLTEMQRVILTLRWEQELTYEQIADALSISVAAAKQHGSRAQRAIRPLLEMYRSPSD